MALILLLNEARHIKYSLEYSGPCTPKYLKLNWDRHPVYVTPTQNDHFFLLFYALSFKMRGHTTIFLHFEKLDFGCSRTQMDGPKSGGGGVGTPKFRTYDVFWS